MAFLRWFSQKKCIDSLNIGANDIEFVLILGSYLRSHSRDVAALDSDYWMLNLSSKASRIYVGHSTEVLQNNWKNAVF